MTNIRQEGSTNDEVFDLRRLAATLRASTGSIVEAVAEIRALLQELGPTDPRYAELQALLSKLTG